MSVEQIKHIEELIQLPKDHRITEQKIQRLTAPGENYGSLMLSVDLKVATLNGNEEIHAVAKLVPPNEFIQKIFNTPVTFRNEIGFYKTIVPALQNFQNEHGVQKIDFAPKYLGSRLNLKGGDQVDQDGILVLENLKISNYINVGRVEGCDLDVAKLVITNLALLHAVPLALKLQKPDVFQKEIMKYMTPWFSKEESFDELQKRVDSLIDRIDELKPIRERIITAFNKQRALVEAREPFATIAHNDCWTNNSMIKFDGTKPVSSKMVDFQICSYGSPGKDLIFFLFSSVKTQILEKHYDDLLAHYYEIFSSTLKKLKCDVAPFSFQALEQELEREATSQFGHVVFMLFPIFADKEEVQDISEFRPDNMMKHEPSDLHKQKFVFVVREFLKRGWI